MPTQKAEGDLYRHKCTHCGNIWYTKTEKPISCANTACRSRRWHLPWARTSKRNPA